MAEQVVVGDGAQVRELEVVNIGGITLFNLLLDIGIDHGKGLAAARRTQDNGGTERVHHVYPAVPHLLLVPETGGQIDGILVLNEPCLLHEGFVLVVEHILHQVLPEQSGHPYPGGQEAAVACGQGEQIETGTRRKGQRQGEQPPIEEEQHDAGGKRRPDMRPLDFFLFHAFRPQAGEREEHKGEQLCPKNGREQPGRPLEIEQYPVHHPDVDVPFLHRGVAEPIYIDYDEQYAEGTHEVHDLGQPSQIIFL